MGIRMSNYVYRLLGFLFTIFIISDLTGSFTYAQDLEKKRAEDAFLAGNYSEALSQYTEDSEEGDEDFMTLYGEALCLLQIGHHYQALEILETIDGDETQQELVNQTIAKVKALMNQRPNERRINTYREEIEGVPSFDEVETILRNDPDYPKSLYYQGIFIRQVFSYPTYEKCSIEVLQGLHFVYEELSRKYPSDQAFSDGLIEVKTVLMNRYLLQSDLEHASQIIKEGLELEPSNIQFQIGTCELYYKQQKYIEVRALCEQLLEHQMESESIYQYLLRIAFAEQDYEKVLSIGEECLKKYPENLYAKAFMTNIYQKLGEKELYHTYLSEIETVGDDDYNQACALAIIGKNRKAISILSNAILLNDDYREYAKNDEDFQRLHVYPSFRKIVQYDYMEELGDYYTVAMWIFGAFFYGVMFLRDYRKEKRRKIVIKDVTMFLVILMVCSTFLTSNVYAFDYELREEEGKEYYEKQRDSDNGNLIFAEDTVASEKGVIDFTGEIKWFCEEIRKGQRTVSVLEEANIGAVADLIKCATVNVQAMSGSDIYGQGSGVIVSYDEKVVRIMGCRHTLFTESMRVKFVDGTMAPARIAGRAATHDVMVLEVSTDQLTEATKDAIKKVTIDFSQNAAMKVKDKVLTIGFITGQGHQIYTGKVSNLRKSFSDFKPAYTNLVPYLLTTTNAQAGSSGGGTFDAYGNFIGIQAGIVLQTGERYIVPLDILVEEYEKIVGAALE
ncbi:MAG: trypsin-like peptidase domain-containing protein [Lachnospiraceae bacterium]|nr:trypsin-like peptidase domain-containing protein [Lachnospiraceae bacterium]